MRRAGAPLSLRQRMPPSLRRMALGLTLAVLLAWAGAASGASFQVSPTRFEFSLARNFTNFFTVTNNSGQELRLRVTTAFVEFDADGKMSEPQRQPHDLSDRIVFNPRRMTLQAGEKRVVRFSVRPPEGLPAGEYRSVVFFEEQPERPKDEPAPGAESGFQIKLLTRVGITVYGRVGEVAAAVSLREPAVSAAGGPVALSALLANTGNAHAQIAVTAELLQGAERVLARAEEQITLQRAQQRRIHMTFVRPPPGTYRVHLVAATGERIWQQEDLPLTVGPATQ